MFRHDDVAVNVGAGATTHGFESYDEFGAGFRRVEQILSMATAEGDEVEVSGALITMEGPWHRIRLVRGDRSG